MPKKPKQPAFKLFSDEKAERIRELYPDGMKLTALSGSKRVNPEKTVYDRQSKDKTVRSDMD